MRSVLMRRGKIALAVVLLAAAAARAQEQPQPLHARIDALIEAAAVGPLNPPASDADFLRRAALDLTGVIPTSADARAFFADTSADKRTKLIDKLLASPQYARHMSLTWDVMLMERRNDKVIKSAEWQDWLRKSFADNKPLDQLCRELVTADGADEATRPAARFLLDRDCEPNLLTRDLGRMLFGMDLQCAQCHDHPLIDDYYQADYYGLFAFVMRSSLFNDAKKKQAQVAEKADGEANYKSVFTSDSADKVVPRLPKGQALALEPTFSKGQEYDVPPAKDVRGVPKYSRRAQLAALLRDSHEFRRNLANRLWAHMFGRGLVHPVDFHHPANPPSHPELLALLADELARSNFDARGMIRELALTRAYQRSCDVPLRGASGLPPAVEEVARLEARRPALAAKIDELKGAADKVSAERKRVKEELERLKGELATAQAAAKTAGEAAAKVAAEQKTADEALAKKQGQAQAVAGAAAKAAEAVAKVADDKVLAQAAAQIAERSKALAAEVETAGKAAADLAAKAKAAADQSAQAQDVVAKATAAMPLQQFAELDKSLLAAQHQLADARYGVTALDERIASARAVGEYQAKQAQADAAYAALVERLTIGCQVAQLKPLTCEQFAASLMQATGVLANQQQAAQAKLDKSPPDSLKNAAEGDRPRLLANLLEEQAFDQLRGNLRAFIDLYGTLQGADFQATVNQSLFVSNGSVLQGWLAATGGHLAERLVKIDDPAALAEELYLSVYTRLPTHAEKDDVAAYLKDRTADRPAAVGEMIWALVSSNEFRFNH
jgi:hypothetical protein